MFFLLRVILNVPLCLVHLACCDTLQTKGDGGNDQDDWAFTPTSRLPDTERFRGVEPLRMTCRACREQADFQGVFAWDRKKPVNGPADIRVSIRLAPPRLPTHPPTYRHRRFRSSPLLWGAGVCHCCTWQAGASVSRQNQGQGDGVF